MNSICRSYTITLCTSEHSLYCTCIVLILTKVLEKGAKTPPTLAKTEAYP